MVEDQSPRTMHVAGNRPIGVPAMIPQFFTILPLLSALDQSIWLVLIVVILLIGAGIGLVVIVTYGSLWVQAFMAGGDISDS